MVGPLAFAAGGSPPHLTGMLIPRPNVILLLDSFFHVVIWRGHVAQNEHGWWEVSLDGIQQTQRLEAGFQFEGLRLVNLSVQSEPLR